MLTCTLSQKFKCLKVFNEVINHASSKVLGPYELTFKKKKNPSLKHSSIGSIFFNPEATAIF